MKINWTSKSFSDLQSISAHISQDNRAAAKKLIQTIRRKALILKDNPFAGRRTEFEGIRELVVHPNYILFYRVSSSQVEILRVWHAARLRYH